MKIGDVEIQGLIFHFHSFLHFTVSGQGFVTIYRVPTDNDHTILSLQGISSWDIYIIANVEQGI